MPSTTRFSGLRKPITTQLAMVRSARSPAPVPHPALWRRVSSCRFKASRKKGSGQVMAAAFLFAFNSILGPPEF